MSDTGRALGTGRRDVQFTSDPGPFKSFLSVPLGETSVPGPFGPVLGRKPDGRTPVRINLKAALGARRCRTGQSVLFGPSAEESRHHRRPIDGVSGPPPPPTPTGGGGGGGGQVAAEPGTPGT